MDEVREIDLNPGELPQILPRCISESAERFLQFQGERQFWNLPAELSTLKDYASMVTAVLAHHTRHQRSKGASPFIVGEVIAVQDRVKGQDFINFLESVANAPQRLTDAVQWRYRRNWHFWRAHRWQSYAGFGE